MDLETDTLAPLPNIAARVAQAKAAQTALRQQSRLHRMEVARLEGLIESLKQKLETCDKRAARQVTMMGHLRMMNQELRDRVQRNQKQIAQLLNANTELMRQRHKMLMDHTAAIISAACSATTPPPSPPSSQERS